MQKFDAFLRGIKTSLSQNDLDAVFKQLSEAISSDSSRYNDVIFQQGRYNSIQRQIENGLISEAFSQRSLNQVRRALLHLIDDIDPQDLGQYQAQEQSSPFKGKETGTKASIEKETDRKELAERIQYLKEEINLRYKSLLEAEEARVRQEIKITSRAIFSGGDISEQELQELKEKISKCQQELRDKSDDDLIALRNLRKKLREVSANSREVVEIASQIIFLDIKDREATIRLGLSLLASEQAEKALVYFNRLLDEEPNNVDLLIYKSDCFKALKDYKGAIEVLQEALTLSRPAPKTIDPKRLDPNGARMFIAIGDNWLAQADWQKALEAYQEAARLDEKSIPAHRQIADLYFQRRNWTEAKVYYEALQQLQQNDYYSHLRIGQIFLQNNELEQAAEALEKAYQSSPKEQEVVQALAQVNRKRGKYAEAIELYQQFLKQDPDNYTVIQELGALYQLQKQFDVAVAYFEQVLEHDPNNINILKELAKNYQMLKEWDQALKVLQKIKKLEPDSFFIKKNLAVVFCRKSPPDYSNSLSLFQEAIKIQKEDESLWKELGHLYIKLKEYENAMEAYRKAEFLAGEDNFKYNLKNPLKLRKICIKDMSFFDDFEWECQPGVNVLLGRNGYGKSYFLRFILSILQKEHKISYDFFGSSQIDADVDIGLFRNGTEINISRKSTKFESPVGKIPVMAIPDVRFLDRSRDSVSIHGDDRNDLAADGAYHFLYQQPYEGLLQNFMYELSITFLDRQKNYQTKEEVFASLPVFALLEDVFKDLTGSYFKFHAIRPIGNARFRIEVITEGSDHTPLPIQKSSQGTLSVLSIFGLIYNYLKAVFPDTPEEQVRFQTGVVIIDEVDAHLHPSWQKKMVYLLRRKFPSVQFFLTAHSPLVVGGCRAKEVCVLRKNPDSDLFNLYQFENDFIGWDTSLLYQRVFSIEEMDEEYLEYNSRLASIKSIRAKIERLEKKKNLDPEEETEYRKLYAEEIELSKFEEIKERQEALNYEKRVKKLEAENRRLKYELEELKNKNQ